MHAGYLNAKRKYQVSSMCGAERAPPACGAAVVLSRPPAGRLQAAQCQRSALLSQEVLAQKAALEAGNKELQDKYNQKAMWVWQGNCPGLSVHSSRYTLADARHRGEKFPSKIYASTCCKLIQHVHCRQDKKLKEGFALLQQENEQLRRQTGMGGGPASGMAAAMSGGGLRASRGAMPGMEEGLHMRPATVLGHRSA